MDDTIRVLTTFEKDIGGRYDATKAMRAATTSFGFDVFMIARVAGTGERGTERLEDLAVLSTWPLSLVKAYDEARMLEQSDILDRVRETALPLWWDLRDLPADARGCERHRALFGEHGMLCHLVLSVADGAGQRLMAGFAGNRDRPDDMEMSQLMRISSEVVEQLRLSEAKLEERGRVSNLTGRQSEALRWVAEGKTSAEAATIMGISSSTVDSYLESVLVRLDCVSRAQAVAKAIRANLI